MNEARKNDQLQPLYPQYISAPYVEDEINLVDLWIALLRYKKTFLIVFSVLAAIGLALAFIIHEEKYTLTSAIQIGSIGNGSSSVQIESTQSLNSKLSNIIIPAATNEWLQNNSQMEKFETSVSNAKGSDIVLIQNKIAKSQIDALSEFHQLLAAAVVSDHQKLIALSQSDLKAELESAKAELKNLEDPQSLQSVIDKQMLGLNTEKTKLSRLQDSYKLYQKGGTESVLQLLSTEEREQLMTMDGQIDSQMLNVRFEKLLLDNQILQDEQKQKMQQINLSMNVLKLDQVNQIEGQMRKIGQIRVKIENFNKTRVVSEPVLSLKPTGMTQSLLILLVLFLAGFGGFCAMLIVMFRDKVNERLLDTQ